MAYYDGGDIDSDFVANMDYNQFGSVYQDFLATLPEINAAITSAVGSVCSPESGVGVLDGLLNIPTSAIYPTFDLGKVLLEGFSDSSDAPKDNWMNYFGTGEEFGQSKTNLSPMDKKNEAETAKLGEKSFFKDYAPILTIGGNLLAGAYTASMNEKIADKNIQAQKELLNQRIQADKDTAAKTLTDKKISVAATAPVSRGLIGKVNPMLAADAPAPQAQASQAQAPETQSMFTKSALPKPVYDMSYYRNNVTGGKANA